MSNVVDQTKETFKKIEEKDKKVKGFLETFEKESIARAEELDQVPEVKQGPLHGVAVAIKDIISTTEGHTTAASQILKNYSAPFDATVVKRLRDAGAVIVGKVNCDEFAMGSDNQYSSFGPVHNPWDLGRVPGGSSGGSGAVVAAGEVPMALGTDTGSSIRIPGSFGNVVSLKPTYGRVSRFGAVAYASSFDQISPIAKTVKDTARLFSVIAGHDENDLTSSSVATADYIAACGEDIKGMKIGVPKEYFGEEVQPEVAAVVKEAIAEMENLGAELIDISLPLTFAAVPTYYLLVKSEASTNLGRFDGLRYGKLDVKSKNLIEHYIEARGDNFGPEAKRAILMGTYALSAGYIDAWYKQASRVRTLIRQEFDEAFDQVDIIAGPVSPEVPWKIGDKADDPLAMYMTDLLCTPASVAGLPAMSVPAGFSKDLPVGMQLIAPHFKEEKLFQAGHAYEQSQEWHKMSPTL